MAKVTGTKIKVSSGKMSAELARTQANTNYFKPQARNLTPRQAYKLGKMQQRTTRYENKGVAQVQKTALNKGADLMKAAGSAIAEASGPWAAQQGATRIAEQAYASKNRENQAISSWNNILDGNPDKASGSEGQSQTSSTTSVLGG